MKLRTDNIKKSYKGRHVVKGVSVEVNQGEIVGLLGPNGAGKTTSFYMIVGLVRPNEGKVYLDDTEITRHAMYRRAQLGIGYLPQEVSVFRKMTVEDNIMTVLEMTDLSKTERIDKLESLLDEFGLQHVRKNMGQSLSGGEKRRTEIARALATDPKFILLDEPFAGVDPIAVEDIQKIVSKLKKKNIGVLITDHNVQETLSITDRTYLLFEGSILREGTAEALAADEMVRKVYLGANFELRKKSSDSDNEIFVDESEVEVIENHISKKIDDIIIIAEDLIKLLETSRDHVNTRAKIITLKNQIEVYKDYYGDSGLPPKCQSLLMGLEYKSDDYYAYGIRSTGDVIYRLFIPIYGWYTYVKIRARKGECLSDTQSLLSQLRILSNELKFNSL